MPRKLPMHIQYLAIYVWIISCQVRIANNNKHILKIISIKQWQTVPYTQRTLALICLETVYLLILGIGIGCILVYSRLGSISTVVINHKHSAFIGNYSPVKINSIVFPSPPLAAAVILYKFILLKTLLNTIFIVWICWFSCCCCRCCCCLRFMILHKLHLTFANICARI